MFRSRIFSLIFLFALPYLSSAEDWVYSVRRGDTLWDLCLEFTHKKNCWQEIGPYNQVEYPPSLRPGTRIRFPISWLKSQPASAELIYIRGEIKVNTPEHGEQLAKTGDQLSMGSSVWSGQKSSASIRFADGSILVIEENSQIVLDALSRHESKGMVDTKVNLLNGTIKSKIQKMNAQSQFKVSTPSAIAAVRGTEFRVAANANKMKGEVFEGVVEVSNAHGKEKVEHGYGIQVVKNQKKLAPRPLLEAPKWREPTLKNIPFNKEIEWHSVPTAQQYSVQLLEDSKEDMLLQEIFIDLPKVLLPIAVSGCYKISVSAIDAQEFKGMPANRKLCSAPQPQTVEVTIRRKNTTPILSWLPVDNTLSYRVDISKQINFSKIVESIETKETSATLKKYGNSSHYVKVTAIGKYGIESNPSNVINTKKTQHGIFFVLSMLGVFLISL